MQKYLQSYMGQWFTADNVYIAAPDFENVTQAPAAFIQLKRATPTLPSTVVYIHSVELAFLSRSASAAEASRQLMQILTDFDEIWSHDDLNLDTELGNWVLKTQLNQNTDFDPPFNDKYGLVVYAAAKTVQVQERLPLRKF